MVPFCEKPSGQRTIILVIDTHHTYSIAARELEQMHPEALLRRRNHNPTMVSDNAHDECGVSPDGATASLRQIPAWPTRHALLPGRSSWLAGLQKFRVPSPEDRHHQFVRSVAWGYVQLLTALVGLRLWVAVPEGRAIERSQPTGNATEN